MRKVLVAGTGQVGSRYLQGLAKFDEQLEVWAYDTSSSALVNAKKRWDEVEQNYGHRIHFCQSVELLPNSFEIGIVASTAQSRPELIKSLSQKANIQAWILEKLLAQSVSGLKKIASYISTDSIAWVNTPMHNYPLYSKLNQKLTKKPINANFLGITGIACNAVHYIDYISRSTGGVISKIDTALLTTWMPYFKRREYFDVEGLIKVYLNDGSTVSISGTAAKSSKRSEISLQDTGVQGGELWRVFEHEGRAISSKGDCIQGKAHLLQSESTPELIRRIIAKEKICLPSLKESIEQHKPLLEALIDHWNKVMPNRIRLLPST